MVDADQRGQVDQTLCAESGFGFAVNPLVDAVIGAQLPPSPELRTAVRTFVNEQCNASRAAARLYSRRNTLSRQPSRADQLLPRPLGENSVSVAVALDVLHWRGRGDG
jgi:DNA-binding PucR family transcriptional regulator